MHSSRTAPRTLLVIPVRNQGTTLRSVAEDGLGHGYNVLVVDDGSTDGCLDAIADLPVMRHRFSASRGKGAAVLAGAALAKHSGYEAILTIDADGRHDPADCKRLLKAASHSWPAIVIGARRTDGSSNSRSPASRRDLTNFLVRLECGKKLPDSRSAFRLYPVAFLLTRRCFSTRNTFETEVLVRAAWAGLPLLSIPISEQDAPAEERSSRFQVLRDDLRSACLHAWLVARSLIPWPHRRMFRREGQAPRMSDYLHPIRLFRQLSREHSGAGELAAAVWVGIFVGALPIVPFGIAAIVYVSHRLHLNKLVAVGASNLCVFPFVPLICVEAGHFLLHGRFLSLFNRHALINEIHLRLWEWLLGSLVFGPVIGAAGALLTYVVVRSLRRRKPPEP